MCNCKRNRPKGQIFELQSNDQKRPDFFQTKFQGNHSEKCVGVSLFLRFQLKNVYTRPDFDFWAFCDPALKTEWIMEQLPKPHKRTQKCIQRKSDWFHRVLCFLKKLSVAVFVQWKHSGSCCIRLTLDGFGGHHFSKGQILKNVANCLKRMQHSKIL